MNSGILTLSRAPGGLSRGSVLNQRECDQLIEEYISWLKRGLEVESINGTCELTTPFLDRHNDHLQIYAQRVGDRIVLSDDGYILADLEGSGLQLSTRKRREVLQTILNGLGVQEQNGRLVVEASERTLGQRTQPRPTATCCGPSA